MIKKRSKNQYVSNIIYGNGLVFKYAKKEAILLLLLTIPSCYGVFVGLVLERDIINKFANDESSQIEHIIILIALYLLMVCFYKVKDYLFKVLEIRMSACLKRILASNCMNIKWECFETQDTSQIIEGAKTEGIEAIVQCFSITSNTIICVGNFGIYIYLLKEIEIKIVAIYLIMALLCFTASEIIFGKTNKIWDRVTSLHKLEKYYASSVLNAEMHQETNHLRLKYWILEKWGQIFENLFEEKIKVKIIYEAILQFCRIVLNLPYFVMFLYSSNLVYGQKMNIGTLIMYLDMFNQVVNLFGSIESMLYSIISRNYYIDCFKKVMLLPNKCDGNQMISDPQTVEFTHVSYKYNNSELYALHDINISINKGEKIFLVGKNGSGKTTFGLILSGIISELDSGKLLINQKPAQSFKQGVVQYLSQEFIRYEASIRENIAAGASFEDISDEQVWYILEKVGLKDFVIALPHGIDTRIGYYYAESIQLSMGQWQRLAIGRLLANPKAKIWILDEPTAYLDPESEVEFYKMVTEVSNDRMVIFISHRIIFSKYADRTLLFSHGEIVAQGSHQKLLIESEEYKRMFVDQHSWFSGKEENDMYA